MRKSLHLSVMKPPCSVLFSIVGFRSTKSMQWCSSCCVSKMTNVSVLNGSRLARGTLTHSSWTPSRRELRIKWCPVMQSVPSTDPFDDDDVVCNITPSSFGVAINSANSILRDAAAAAHNECRACQTAHKRGQKLWPSRQTHRTIQSDRRVVVFFYRETIAVCVRSPRLSLVWKLWNGFNWTFVARLVISYTYTYQL